MRLNNRTQLNACMADGLAPLPTDATLSPAAESDGTAAQVAPAGTSNSTLVGVQLLRGLAALLVVFHHYVGTSVERGFAIAGLDGTQIGNAGVDIFFIISGFIMEYTSGGKRYAAGDRAVFLKRRMIRILPLYWTLTIVAFLIIMLFKGAVNSSTTWNQLLMSMLLLPGPDNTGKHGYVIAMAWTLSYEFYFYLVFSLLLGTSPRKRLAVLSMIFGACAIENLIFSPKDPILGILTNPLVFEFLAGCLLAQLYRSGKSISQLSALLLAMLAVAILLAALKVPIENSWLRLALWGIPAALLVYGAVLMRKSGAGTRHFPFTRAFQHVGDISYSLYLSHFFSLAIAVRLYALASKKWAINPWLAGISVFALSLLVAHICYRLIENPSRNALQNRFIGTRRVAGAT